MTDKPEFYASDLLQDRLVFMSEKLLEVLDEAHSYSESPNATAWFRGTANYGLAQGMLRQLHHDSNYPWLKLANQTMDYTVRIGNTLVQFVVDDPHAPKKTHRLKRNEVEQYQMALQLENDPLEDLLVWRFYLNPIANGVDYSPSITLLGFDSDNNVVCKWEYDSVISGPSATELPEVVEIDEPALARKKDKRQKQSSE